MHSLLLQVPLPPHLLLSQTIGRKKREEEREGNRKGREEGKERESERERHEHYVLLIKA